MMDRIRNALAPHGTLRAAMNMANFLLVSGEEQDGTLKGVSPDLARRIAHEINVPCDLVLYDSPGALADDVHHDRWDIGNIAAEAERAVHIDFSCPYVMIDANFMVPRDAPFTSNAEMDAPEIRIAAYERSAYDLWLTENFTKAQMIRSESIGQSHADFNAGKADVLASLKPKLLEEMAGRNDVRIIEPLFTGIMQAVGIRKGYPEALAFLDALITDLIQSGFIKTKLETHGVADKLSVPSADEPKT